MGSKQEKSWEITLIPLSILLSLLMPLPSILLDIGLCLNFIFSLTIVFWIFSLKSFQSAKVFPFLFLYLCLFRLGLNLASTRKILASGWASPMIQSLGSFFSLDNLGTGVIACFCIFLVNFIVIAKGAERVAEVRARFILEALPGKQMSLDADVLANRDSYSSSKQQKKFLVEESDFFSSMEGVFRFVKGDAVVSCILLLVNIIAVVKFSLYSGFPLSEMWQTVIGDALVSQMPALLISCSAATLIAKVGDGETLVEHIITYYEQTRAYFAVIAGFMSLLLWIPEAPKATISFFILCLLLGYRKPKQLRQLSYLNITLPMQCILPPSKSHSEAKHIYNGACELLLSEMGISFDHSLSICEGEHIVFILGEQIFYPKSFSIHEIVNILREAASEVITTKHIRQMIHMVQENQGFFVDEIIPNKVSENTLMFLTRLLIKERVPLFLFPKMLESMVTYDQKDNDIEAMVQHVRKYLGKMIGKSLLRYKEQALQVITIDSYVEQMIQDAYARSHPNVCDNMVNQIKTLFVNDTVNELKAIVTGCEVRYEIKQMIAPHLPNLLVLAHNELPEDVSIKVIGAISDDVLVS